jgi:DNA (cytosine-5)-methyltransferase 1
MGGLKYIPETKNGAYKAFGNAVNVEVVKQIMSELIKGSSSLPIEKPYLAAE